MRTKTKYRIALGVTIVLLIFFAYRAMDSYRALIEQVLYGRADVRSLRGWMSMEYISRMYGADQDCICSEFDLKPDECLKMKIWETRPNEEKGASIGERVLDERNELFEKVTVCQDKKPLPQDWMSMGFLSRLHGLDLDCVCDALGASIDDCSATLVHDVRKSGSETGERTNFRKIIIDCGNATRGP
ncbi:hypothetical protein ACFLRF_00500 [Candidatus Altiarchaeota archaeon]